MPENGFEVGTINLSFANSRVDPAATGFQTANVYTVEGVNGGRPMSISGLVMALCLSRATAMEERIIEIMADMEDNSDKLQTLTEIEKRLVENRTLSSADATKLGQLGVSLSGGIDDIIRAVESKMDSLNSFSQQAMIDLQSNTNKRDQAYDMLSNILKTLNTTLMAIANNA